MSDTQLSPNPISAVGFRILTCRINKKDDSAAFTDSPLIGWLQSNDPDGSPVDPVFLDESGAPVLGSEMDVRNVSYRVFHSELHEGQRFKLKAGLEEEARFMEETTQRGAQVGMARRKEQP